VSRAPVALVTGASRGIGKASAVALAAAGFDVALAARTLKEGTALDDSGRPGTEGRRLPGSLEATAGLVEASGRRSLQVRMDLSDLASVEAAAATVLGAWGAVDVLVNNAVHTGPGSMETFGELTLDMVRQKLEANVVAQLALIKQVLPSMLDRGSGVIVNVTSAVAVSDPPAPAGRGGWGLGYAMSKAAFHRVAGVLAVELAGTGVYAYNLEPGYVVTERMAMDQAELGFEGRYHGAPPSVPAAVVAWLATSPDAPALNGTTVQAQREALSRSLHPDLRR